MVTDVKISYGVDCDFLEVLVVSMGMPQWVTIAQAIKLTGKSENTIRRFIYDLQKKDTELATKVIQKSSTGAYQIEKEFLCTKYPSIDTNKQPMSNNPTTHQVTQELDPIIEAKDQTIAILQSQLERQAADFKEQLARKDEQVKMAFERMRENHLILQGLALPAPQKGTALEPLEVLKGTNESNHGISHDVPVSNSSEQPKQKVMGTKHKQKPSKLKRSEQPKKKGFLSFLTGK